MTHPLALSQSFLVRPALPRRRSTITFPSTVAGVDVGRAALVLLITVLVSGWLAWTHAGLQERAELAARTDCVVGTLHEAQAFAAVQGDPRRMPLAVAERACGAR